MMGSDIEAISKLLGVLADSTRLNILQYVKSGDRKSNDIVEHFGKSQSTISQHLKLLVEASLLKYRRDGTKKFYSIQTPEVFDVLNSVLVLVSQIKLHQVTKITRDARDDTLS